MRGGQGDRVCGRNNEVGREDERAHKLEADTNATFSPK
jgi:hypothetical protein